MDKLGKTAKVRINVRKLREFHEEIVFFIKSFFFVYIGVVVTLSWKYTFLGFTLVIMQMVMRYGLVTLIGRVFLFTREEISISKVVYASGLPAFVMSQLPQLYDPTGAVFLTPGLYPDICMPIVLGTILYSGLIGPWMITKELSYSEKAEHEEMPIESPPITGEDITVYESKDNRPISNGKGL